jgi:nucleotide-binding universal stress UspA family protein
MKSIVVTTDLSEQSTAAFDSAKEQADIIGRDNCVITILTALEEISASTTYVEFGLAPIVDEPFRKEWIRNAKIAIRKIIDEHFQGYQVNEMVTHSTKSIGEEISSIAKELSAEMIVISSHGRSGIGRFLLGSVAEKVVQHALCSVLVVFSNPKDAATSGARRNILLLTDLSEESFSAFPVCKKQLEPLENREAQLTLLYVSQDLTRATFGLTLGEESSQIRNDIQEKAEKELNDIRDTELKEPLANTVVLLASRPIYEEIAQYAKTHHVDLIVVATHGNSKAKQFLLGGVTEKLIRISPCPILVARAGS